MNRRIAIGVGGAVVLVTVAVLAIGVWRRRQ